MRASHLLCLALVLAFAANANSQQQQTGQPVFPYGEVPETKPDMPLSKAMNRVYEGTYAGLDCARNELFSRFKYTPLKGFNLHGKFVLQAA